MSDDDALHRTLRLGRRDAAQPCGERRSVVRLWNDIDRLFGDVVRGTGPSELGPTGKVGLPIEVADTGTGLEVVAEPPGVEEKGVSVELMGNTRPSRVEEGHRGAQDSGCHLAERRYGIRAHAAAVEVEAAA